MGMYYKQGDYGTIKYWKGGDRIGVDIVGRGERTPTCRKIKKIEGCAAIAKEDMCHYYKCKWAVPSGNCEEAGTATKAKVCVSYVMVGNPGVGKSSILNG